MTQQAALPAKNNGLWRRARGVPFLIILAAAFNEAGINSATAAAIVTLAVPATATVFIYEVSVLRGAQLEREAVDRARREVAFTATKPQPEPEGSVAASGAPVADVSAKLDTMLTSRSAMLDTFGDDPSTVAPIYVRIIKQMLKDDVSTFALLKAKRDAGSEAQAAPLKAKEVNLRAVHDRLSRLIAPQAPALSAASLTPKTSPGG